MATYFQYAGPMSKNDCFIKACRREPTDRIPVWFMRQAGRYMPEYRAIREKHTFLEMVKNPELAAEITLQPIKAYDIDAGIIFSDILPLVESMGLSLEFIKGEGPVFHSPIRSAEQVEALTPSDPNEQLSYTLDAIRLTKTELGDSLPLIGFSGAPFTLACYAIEGGSSPDYEICRSFMKEESAAFHTLMQKLSNSIVDYLLAQVQAGADALQLFDSWVGILPPEDFRIFVQPYSMEIIKKVKQATNVPVIYFGTGPAPFSRIWHQPAQMF